MTLKSSFNYFLYSIYWPVIISSYLMGLPWSNFFIVLRHDQGVTRDPVIKYGSSTKSPFIVRYIIGLLWTHFYGLDGPGLAIKDEQNRQSGHCIRRGFAVFAFLVNKQVVYFYIGFFCSSFPAPLFYLYHPCSLCIFWPCKISPPSSSPLRQYIRFLFCHGVTFVFSEHLIFLDGILVEMIQHVRL